MRRAICHYLCCCSCGSCGCCEGFYVLLPPLLRLLLLSVAMRLLKVGLPEAANDHYEINEIKCVSR